MITFNANSMTADAKTVGPHVAVVNAHSAGLERIVHHADLTIARINGQPGLKPVERADRSAAVREAAAQAMASVEAEHLKKLNTAKDDAAKTRAIALMQQSTRQATAAAGRNPKAAGRRQAAQKQAIIFLNEVRPRGRRGQ